MIKLNFKEGEVGIFTEMFTELYKTLSVNPLPNTLDCVRELNDYLKVLYGDTEVELTNNTILDNIKIGKIDNKKVLVGFTAGKDSLATTLQLIEQGYEPILFHLKGVNRSYPHELDYVKALGEKLNLEVVYSVVGISGKCDYKEHPIKNQFILANMVDYGVKRGIVNYSMGNVKCDLIKTQNIFYNYSDSLELFNEIEKFYKCFIPNFKFITILDNNTHSYQIIAKRPELLNNISSCMLPLRYKPNTRKANLRKFGDEVTFLDGRCGSCYKCAYEYIHLVALGVFKYNEAYYKHCLKCLKKSVPLLFPKDTSNLKDEYELLRLYIDEKRIDLKKFIANKDSI